MSLAQRFAVTAFAAVALLAVPAQALAAPTYPPGGGNSITVSTTSPTVGDTVTVSAKTFQAGSDVAVDVAVDESGTSSLRAPSAPGGSGRLGAALPLAAAGTCEPGVACTVVAATDGIATASVKLTAAGTTNITFEGTGADGQPLTQTVEITTTAAAAAPAAPEPSGEGLASTGSAIVQYLVIGVALVTIGAVIMSTVGRRPRELQV